MDVFRIAVLKKDLWWMESPLTMQQKEHLLVPSLVLHLENRSQSHKLPSGTTTEFEVKARRLDPALSELLRNFH
jgi:hypothetical protein